MSSNETSRPTSMSISNMTPRGGHPACLQALRVRPPARCDRDRLSEPQRDPRSRQGVWTVQGCARRSDLLDLGLVGGGRDGRAGAPRGPRRLRSASQPGALAGQLHGFPRHLSQHVGGFVISETHLDEIVPIENAAMEKRKVIEWDKDDLDVLQILKVDVLALGMLSCLRAAFDLIESNMGLRSFVAAGGTRRGHSPFRPSRKTSEAVYNMLSRATDRRLPGRDPRADVDATAPAAKRIL